MDMFPDGGYVRLRSRVHGGYLHADEDGVGVSLHERRASLNTAWQVHHVVRHGVTYVLLHGAAYGRYLAATEEPAPSGHRGQRVVQGVFDHPEANDVAWRVFGVGVSMLGDEVILRHISFRLLRANGRYRVWNTDVTVDHHENRSTMMHWVVDVLQMLPEPPAIPPPVPLPHPGGGGFLRRFRSRTVPLPMRTIHFVRADFFGNFNELGWRMFQFQGRSVFLLRARVADQVGEAPFFFNITVCTRAGRYGRLTPLTTDLPQSYEAMDIIALTSGTPGTQGLLYPNVHAVNIDAPF